MFRLVIVQHSQTVLCCWSLHALLNVVKNLLKRLQCSTCKAALSNSAALDTVSADYGLLNVKDRGGLISPSDDVVRLCKVSESHFRSQMGPSDKPAVATNLQDLLTCSVLRSFVGADIFMGLTEHTFDTDPVAVSYTHLTLPTNREV